jgi:ribosomal protein S18 acetylase RimI-like enzyme
MNLAKREDKLRVIEIFKESYIANPHVRFLLGDRMLALRMQHLASYVFDIAFKRNGVYLSTDREGVVVMFPMDKIKLSFGEKLKQLSMVILAFNSSRILRIKQIESEIQQVRSGKANDYYVWFYGVSNKGRHQHTARELMRAMFQMAQTLEIELIAETSIARNKIIYERYGFETYKVHHYEFPVYFMRRAHTTQKVN